MTKLWMRASTCTFVLFSAVTFASPSDFKITATRLPQHQEVFSLAVASDPFVSIPHPTSQWECVARDHHKQGVDETMNLICCAKGSEPIACTRTSVTVAKGQHDCNKLDLQEGPASSGDRVEVTLCGDVK